MKIDRKLLGGEYIIYKNGLLYLADRGRNKMEEFEAGQPMVIVNGKSEITVQALGQPVEKSGLDVVVTVMGKAEKI